MNESDKSEGWVQLQRLADPHEQEKLQSDAELLSLYVDSGDVEAIERLIRRHAAMVASVCKLTVSDRSSAEDAFQATFLVLLRSARSIRRRKSVGAWLHGVAYRTSCRIRKQKAKALRQPSMMGEEQLADQQADDSEEPIVRLARKMELEALDRELENLPDPLRTPLVEHYLMGMSAPEIAERMELSLSAVEGRLKRGRRKLRNLLVRRGISLSLLAAGSGFFRQHVQATDAIPWTGRFLDAGYIGTQAEPFTSSVSSSPQISSLVQGEIAMLSASTLKSTLVASLLLLAGALAVVAADPLQSQGQSQGRSTSAAGEADGLMLPAKSQVYDVMAQFAQDETATQPAGGTSAMGGYGGGGYSNVAPMQVDGPLSQPTKASGLSWQRPASGDEVPIWLVGGAAYMKRADENRAALAQKIQFDLAGIPLKNVVAWLSDETQVQFVLNETELDLLGVDPDTPIRLESGKSTVRELLNRILDPLELAYVVHESTIELTSKDDSESSLAMRFYDLSYILPNASNADSLMNAIQQTIHPDSWLANGGTSSIVLVGSMMIVAAPETTHHKIEILLTSLAKMNPRNAEQAAPAETGPMGMGSGMGMGMGGGGYGTDAPGR